MKNIKNGKDFFYDKNDIILALVIILLAGLLIVWRMNVIMNYPHTLATETGTEDTTEPEAITDEDGTTSKDGAGSKDDTASSSIWTDGKLTKSVTVTVASGSATGAVQSLIDAGLFKSYDEFAEICNAAGYRPEDIKATTFTFKAGCTQTDIALQVTQ